MGATAPDHTPQLPLIRYPALAGGGGLYLTGEDHLRITSFNAAAGVTLGIEGRYITPEGRIVASGDRHVPNTDRTSASTVIPLGEGWLIDVMVRATAGTPRRAQCFVVLELVRGLSGAVVPVALLAQGYVTDTSRFGFPFSGVEGSTSGPGVLRSIAGANPAAGAEISETVPTNARWRLLAIQFSLVTAVAVANREVALTLDDGATVFARVPSGFTHVASTTIVYSTFHHAPRNTAAQDTTKNFPLPRVDLQGGFRFNTVTTALQGADDYGAPQYLVEEWIED